jgi:hypothetical protein
VIDWIHRDAVACVEAELQASGVNIGAGQLQVAFDMVQRIEEADRARKLRGLARDRQQQDLDEARHRARTVVSSSQR